MFWIHLLVVLVFIFIGARKGGIAIWMLEKLILSAIRNGTAKNSSIQK